MSKKTTISKFEVTNETDKKSPLSTIKIQKIKNAVLGKQFELSLVFIGRKKSKKLNKKWRNKNKFANVLSFPLEKNNGEIFIDLETPKTEAEKFNMTFKKYIGFLFIHGALHLKGFDHGTKMEQEEQKFLKKFSIFF